jgi:hypothetical protein
MTRTATGSLAVAAIAAAILGLSGVAAAAARYSVKLTVPHYVTLGQTFKLHAKGVAGTRSRLEVFVASKRCASSAASEAKRASRVLISKNVVHGYTGAKAMHASPGTHHVCAYLMSTGHDSLTRARASATYYVLTGGY